MSQSTAGEGDIEAGLSGHGSLDNGRPADIADRPQPTRFSFARKKGVVSKVARETGKKENDAQKEIVVAIGEDGIESTGGMSKEEKIIPKQENRWRPEKKMRSIYVPGHESPTRNEDRFVIEHIEAGPEANVQYGLNLRQAGEGNGKEEHADGARERQVPFAELELQKLRQELEELPEEADMDAYESMPIEDFGAAMLRGMGWEKGKAIGRNGKGPVEPVEYVPRVGRLGLGATPKPEQVKEKKFLKPGDSRGPKPDMVAAVGPDGKVRHVKPVGEQLVERIKAGVIVGKVMRIIGGRHEGLRAEVVSIDKQAPDSGRSERATVKLLRSEEKVVVRVKELVDIGSLEEERAMKEKEREEEERGRDRKGEKEGRVDKGGRETRHSRGVSLGSARDGKDQTEELGQRDRRDGRTGRDGRLGQDQGNGREARDRVGSGAVEDRKRFREDGAEQRSGGERDLVTERGEEAQGTGGRGAERRGEDHRISREESKEGRHKHNGHGSAYGGGRTAALSNGKAPAATRSWLRNQIRVRIVDKNVARGRLYLKKGTIVDVSGPTVCDILVDETQQMAQLEQRMLETLVPKRGGRVAVVAGKYKGEVGKLLEKNVDDGVATVQLAESFELVTLELDMIAEFVGEHMLEEG